MFQQLSAKFQKIVPIGDLGSCSMSYFLRTLDKLYEQYPLITYCEQGDYTSGYR